MSPDGTRVYESNGEAALVTVISTATNTIIATIPSTVSTEIPLGNVEFVPPPEAAIYSISFNPSNMNGGTSTTGTIILSAAAPDGGARVSLVSNDASVTVPHFVVVRAGSKIARFPVTTTAVARTLSVTVTATWKSVGKTAEITLSPHGQVSVSSVSVNPIHVTSGVTATGTVTLSAPAPAGGVVVFMWTNGSPAFVPTSITIPAGAVTGAFPVSTNWVSSVSQGTITAFYNGFSKTTTITVAPVLTLLSVSVAANLGGGLTALGRVTLTDVAPAEGLVVYLRTEGSAALVPTSVTVAPGTYEATFLVTTVGVTSPEQETVIAFYQGTIRTAVITVTP